MTELRVVKGDPTPEEVAALVTALVSVLAASPPAPARRAPVRKKWANPAHGMRMGLPRGPGAWRSAMLRH
ncbi:acyl-CoA carboxylase subunit epsilon [Microtetraspora niveoalba]|uniref:acyl-CoA carboxylase subunit epsilon n=1 Tax=Microtetraspora niveoalba TaxID=46175 RepID=UPI0009FE403D|nr:acyl-CoA carboxylase subunit epsilon [Microtetraspora niveoalba]